MAQVMDADGEVHARRGDGWSPDPGSEGVPGGGPAVAGREQQVTVFEAPVLDVGIELVNELGWQAHGAWFVVFGVGLGEHPTTKARCTTQAAGLSAPATTSAPTTRFEGGRTLAAD